MILKIKDGIVFKNDLIYKLITIVIILQNMEMIENDIFKNETTGLLDRMVAEDLKIMNANKNQTL